MHHPCTRRFTGKHNAVRLLIISLVSITPELALAQASPFMTGATALQTKTFGRSGGSSAVSAAAYRAGERIRDERSGRTYDHTDRRDVLHKEIILPRALGDEDMGWAKLRSELWNTAEIAESRRNARVAREYLVALPAELDSEQRLDLVRGFSQELVERYRFALDLAVHAPRDFPGSDPRNFHAHLLATTREITAQGLSAKTSLELSDARRHALGLGPAIQELLYVRERWATVTNEALRDAHIDAQIDHRTLAAQGIDREPYPYIPRAAFEMERHGYRSAQAERLREDYRSRIEARLQRDAVAGAGAASNTAAATNTAVAAKTTAAPDAAAGLRSPQTLEEIRRQAREDWLRMRQEAVKASSANSPAAAAGQTREWVDDDHLSR
jgi:ATP-dependent exoDNAse (exonuclease V) alpha subunit